MLCRAELAVNVPLTIGGLPATEGICSNTTNDGLATKFDPHGANLGQVEK